MLINKIVIAEDDDNIAHMVAMALGDAGFLCLRARNGEEALHLVRMHAPDLLVLDVMMPVVDGLEVARRLKADVISSKTPILMLTARSAIENKIEGLDAGADDYLAKPFDLREVSARVRALIRASKRERERNPTTELPGSSAIEEHVRSVLSSRDAKSVLHFDIRNFDTYADKIGFANAEKLVRSLGELVLLRTRAHSAGSAFVGHLGGVDFIAVTEEDQATALADEVVEGFEKESTQWVRKVEGEDTTDTQALVLAIAIVPTAAIDVVGPDAAAQVMAKRMAEAMREAKQRDRSNYVVWQAKSR